MRLGLLTTLVMVAFAANSVLNRWAVGAGHADPGAFAIVRVLSGAAVLCLLVLLRGGGFPWSPSRRALGAGALTLYMVGFSVAYLSLDAGIGALILFGVIQIVMFGWIAATSQPPSLRQLVGAGIAFGGLLVVLWPTGPAQVSLWGAGVMAAAGVGWAAYTLAGRTESDALSASAANFLVALPLTAGAVLALGPQLVLTLPGAVLAILSGAVTSGLGYALWYRVLPRLGGPIAATVQLSVPLIAMAGGALLLAEPVGWRLLAGAGLLVGGIALVIRRG